MFGVYMTRSAHIRYEASDYCSGAADQSYLAAVGDNTLHQVVSQLYAKPAVIDLLPPDGGMWIGLHSNQWKWING